MGEAGGPGRNQESTVHFFPAHSRLCRGIPDLRARRRKRETIVQLKEHCFAHTSDLTPCSVPLLVRIVWSSLVRNAPATEHSCSPAGGGGSLSRVSLRASGKAARQAPSHCSCPGALNPSKTGQARASQGPRLQAYPGYRLNYLSSLRIIQSSSSQPHPGTYPSLVAGEPRSLQAWWGMLPDLGEAIGVFLVSL